MQAGLTELCSRPVVRGRAGQTEGRRDVLGKTELKKMGLASPTWGEGLATALYFGTRFLNLVQIDGPALATSVAQAVTVTQILRAPGNNYKFRRNQQTHPEAIEVPMPSFRASAASARCHWPPAASGASHRRQARGRQRRSPSRPISFHLPLAFNKHERHCATSSRLEVN